MAVGVGAMGALAVAANPTSARRATGRDSATSPSGIARAAALYGIFRAGDRFARRFLPTGAEDIAEVYERRRMRPPVHRAGPRAGHAPGEELFWRGLVNGYLMQWPWAASPARRSEP